MIWEMELGLEDNIKTDLRYLINHWWDSGDDDELSDTITTNIWYIARKSIAAISYQRNLWFHVNISVC